MQPLINIQSGIKMTQIDITKNVPQWDAEREYLKIDMEKILL